MNVDELYMSRCIQLARYGAGYVAPNPMVGAVVVCDGKIIGEGYHRRYGEAHAEPNAINSVKDKALLKNSTMYVSLEPCSHYGKTPPCADLIVSCGIPKVVVGTLDPNPKVAGRGVAKLREAGIDVKVGCLESECEELNKRFFTFQKKKCPYISLKWAQTRDGYIDNDRKNAAAPPLLISNELTKMLVHKQRVENQTIMVGTNTAVLDNPSLTVRNWAGVNPVRIVLDEKGRIPSNYHLLDGAVPTIVYTGQKKQSEQNPEYELVDFDDKVLESILKNLYERNIHSVLVEGGASLLNSFIQQGLWDEATVEVAPNIAGGGVKAPSMCKIPCSHKEYQGHTLLYYKNEKCSIK
ncbi:bifunctional diaminohydroxyphosphoribosylaminopyrimidine deaminase/5-amino-6-(5-phosphoribosylamino)uracil reductase RibD [Paludibacter sp. 221]|uniref:bifunctional diaminohydroxyphosphoribosylaminopyrimidine deaminase/5-amino-6-(5-phosphoribosylamino)uracil reductase RibD n=1 Tax=Paludibacter sp. 221 TaxID=2302939 RepID=UPI0013D461D7|nr:bifunctional diaminohydroxyphosphoribosylaminopyrimidine deaminase/5-amino-6-(5-phosphoribosylamino)uracil reductase RibD [Paludibacter sp. 221]NDV46389.1 bifunctional diaminohydroxyphosphoribosylaminopyrimidine deaminase/5-amino-6-(5-phosphoribosylamino)uracil reductase RibD [Paludibacter sp. 221]